MESKVQSYRDLIAWQKSMEMTTAIFNITKSFPSTQNFTLTSQLQRAAISIPSNIAEGFSRNTKKHYLHFLNISLGSTYEVQTQIEIANNVGLLNDKSTKEMLEQAIEVEKILHGLIRSLKNSKRKPNP